MLKHENIRHKTTSKLTQKLLQHLPPKTKFILSAVPGSVVKSGLNFWLNTIFKYSLRKGELNFLQRRYVGIQITDIALRFSVTLQKNGLHTVVNPSQADVEFKATAVDLLLLITGKVDPDTLFFRRRLMITGDTELGLAVKNFLDTLDAKAIIPTPLYPLCDYLAKGFVDQHDQKKAATTTAC